MGWPVSIRRSLAVSSLVAAAGIGHALYPVFLLVRTRSRPTPTPPAPTGEWPAISVIVPAYREAEVIRDKVADVFENGYRGPVEVVVIAEDEETAAAARETAAVVEGGSERLGKARAMNVGARAAAHDILVYTDANTRLLPGSLAALVAWFDDPEVGAVAGEKSLAGDGREGMYWAFESWLKRREWRLGTTIGVSGELAAVRRSLFRPLPADLAVDDLWLGLDVVEAGSRIAYEPTARTVESASYDLRDDWERRTRVVVGALDVLSRRRALLRPGSPVAAQLWGHRLGRLTVGPLAHVALLAFALATARRSAVAKGFLALHAVGGVALARDASGRDVTKPEQLLGHVLFLQVVALGGLARYARGDRPALWSKPERAATPDLWQRPLSNV